MLEYGGNLHFICLDVQTSTFKTGLRLGQEENRL